MRDTLIVVAFVLLVRLPFLNLAIQGDDVYYLSAAQYTQIDPAHPSRFEFVFQGDRVSWRGHPHPPLNVWFQAALLAATGDIDERVYHGAYLLFSLIAALAALSLARRFTSLPLLATLLFVATPAFIINGTSLESDLPFLAFWLASIALYIRAVDSRSGWLLAASVAVMPFAAMAAFQSVLLIPLLGLYLWQRGRDWKSAWAVLAVVPATLGAWQLFERLTTEQLPAQAVAIYFSKYGLQTLLNKLRNAAALTAHTGWLVFPVLAAAAFLRKRFPMSVAVIAAVAGLFIDANPLFWVSFGIGAGVIAACIVERREFPAAWILLFFASALALFFAGSARYLLPMAVPVVILATKAFENRPRWLWAAFALQLPISLALAKSNADHWNGYREFIATHSPEWQNRRVWSNTELGMRFYAESAGAIPVERGQSVRPGDFVLSSRLAFPTPFTTGGGSLVPVAEQSINSAIPLRIFGLDTRSGYSTASLGFRPFDIHTGPIDVVRIDQVVERKPTLSYLPMTAPEAETQIASGIYALEENRYRWMGRRAVILLKPPPNPAPIAVEYYLPGVATAKKLRITLDGKLLLETACEEGSRKVVTPPASATGATATLAIEVDRTFQAAGDPRELGLILVAAGFSQTE